MQGRKNGETIPLHPLFFALYAPLALLASNILQIRPVDSYRSFVVFAIIGAFLYISARLFFKNWKLAAILSSILILLLISYGQVYTSLKSISIGGEIIGRHRYLIPLWLLIGLLSVIGVFKYKRDLSLFSNLAYIISIALIFLPVFQLVNNYVLTIRNETANAISVSNISEGNQNIVGEYPDVYYIILDMYGRDDVLLDKFHYDNSDFLKQLEGLGFTVTRCSVTNYNMTELSLASSFNMNYLDTLGSQYKAGNKDRSGLPSLIHNSAVRRIFEEKGYRLVNFETGFTFTEIRDADEFLIPSYHELENGKSKIRINAFESLLLKTTAFVIVSDAKSKWLTPVTDALDMRREHVIREKYLLDKLPTLAHEASPKFVYAHILIPHPPFVFTKEGVNMDLPSSYGPDGSGPSTKDYAVGYRNQLDYINMRIIPILDEIITNSATLPIIIIQGDHGVDPKRSFILNAYYLPGQDPNLVWQDISPVNTFRLVLNTYFNGNYPILPDINYESKDKAPFDFEVVHNGRVCTQ